MDMMRSVLVVVRGVLGKEGMDCLCISNVYFNLIPEEKS